MLGGGAGPFPCPWRREGAGGRGSLAAAGVDPSSNTQMTSGGPPPFLAKSRGTREGPPLLHPWCTFLLAAGQHQFATGWKRECREGRSFWGFFLQKKKASPDCYSPALPAEQAWRTEEKKNCSPSLWVALLLGEKCFRSVSCFWSSRGTRQRVGSFFSQAGGVSDHKIQGAQDVDKMVSIDPS